MNLDNVSYLAKWTGSNQRSTNQPWSSPTL